uniref:Uncharacterized protein n=1 Tax=Cyanistes caeruleus TaxID=156563 RepID=A0A8C0VBU6_CYACU
MHGWGFFFLQKLKSWLLCFEETIHNAVHLCSLEAILACEERQREHRLKESLVTALKDCHKKSLSWMLLIAILLRDLSSGDQVKIMANCTKDVHGRDVLASLQAWKVSSSRAFAWLSQVCQRWDDVQKPCFANICDAWFQYFYEYLGNTPCQVITSLTDR